MPSARRFGPALRFAISIGLLAVLALMLDGGAVISRLADLSLGWVAAGLALSVGQFVLLGWRWSFTAGRLGLELPLRSAISEYYLGVFLNQVLPGGVTGDVSRAWRHARAEDGAGPAVGAVVIERLSAQIVMTTVAAVSVLMIPEASTSLRFTALVVVVGFGVGLWWSVARASPTGPSSLRGLRLQTREALLTRSALPLQLLSALAVVGSYVAMYLIAARAIGIETGAQQLLPLIAPVLMTMLIPVTVAGWGIREGAAAGLWGVVGLTPEDGVAISVAYGLLVLASTAPGALVLTSAIVVDRGRRGRPGPSENA